MQFEHLMAKAAEEADDHELVELTVKEVKDWFDGKDLPDLSDSLDWKQALILTGVKKVSWIIIKIVP
jgi:hypothetical protein